MNIIYEVIYYDITNESTRKEKIIVNLNECGDYKEMFKKVSLKAVEYCGLFEYVDKIEYIEMVKRN